MVKLKKYLNTIVMLLILILSPVSSFGAEEQGVQPQWGGKDPKSALELDMDDDNGEDFYTLNIDNWYYTETSKKGKLTFGVHKIDSGDDLDMYVYDSNLKPLCSNIKSGNTAESCSIDKTDTQLRKYYIKIIPKTKSGLYATGYIQLTIQETKCEFTSATWGKKQAKEGESVSLAVAGNSYCNGKTISFQVKEKDIWPDPDDPASSNPPSKTMSNGAVTSTWTAEWQCDGEALGVCTAGDPEWYFIATGPDGASIQSSADLNTYKKCIDNDGDGYGKPASDTIPFR